MDEPGPAERLTGEGAKISIYFGSMAGGEIGPTVEYVHAEAILLTCPEFLKRVTKWGIISLPFATTEAIYAMIRFFYTGKVPFHEVHKFTLRPDIEQAYDLAIHIYSQAVYSDITKMKDQATEYMTSLFPYMEPSYMLAYSHSVLEPLYPELNFEWVAAQAGLPYYANDKLMDAVDAERKEDIKRFRASVARREAAWVKINREGEEEESVEESEVKEATEVENDVAVESEAEDSEAEETDGEADAGTDDESYDSKGKLKIIGADGLINLDLANYPPGVYRW
ncbi:hypothetical protein CEK26_009621 [Fusarium fujikuroi]|uniref:Uncharacterized protein n=1 Tax=Fusarium fujikuroi TaxID=5127 RepID=A0A2H3RID5_FUSFU|nr:uncharacterized protein Y057_10882 [Fusarium fujikuroi]KLP12807.1 uncharacterized protein LW94_1062 [Fusarium fujikuroi]QGI65671.1 hypothetical protein CEK27_009642 [Fusarium fujikuroi]QGI96552.1 hypothetical protein CEK26_009621 [Fusarium fujikuroi]SCN83350.1 uncharacterized protein FFE2_05388 [Fusarium fujikuroi]